MLILPKTTLITHLQRASSDPLLSLDVSQISSFYSDFSEMGLDTPVCDWPCTARWSVEKGNADCSARVKELG